ncbi:tetratricopeptide repeat protein, partial [bacterium]|nr:tetratricopeptide repeat protein [bacterium]
VNIFAERYLYFPLIGTVVFLVNCLEKFFRINKRKFLLIFLFLCVILVSRSVVRNNDWHDSLTLWNATMRVEPDSHRALSNLATLYFQQQNYKKAIEFYLECLQIKQNAQNRYNLANCYMRIKDYKQAVIQFNKALALDPSYSEIYNNLALTYLYMNMLDKAEDTLKKSIAYRRPDVMYYENLGLVKDKQGSRKTAIECFQKALVLNPDKSSIYNKIGVSYYHIGDEKNVCSTGSKVSNGFRITLIFIKTLRFIIMKKIILKKKFFTGKRLIKLFLKIYRFWKIS